MKNALKLVVTDFFIITLGVLVCTSISNSIDGHYQLDWYYPWLVIGTGVITAIPSLLFYFKNEPTRTQFILRIIIHFCIIESIVLVEGAMFGWYSSLLYGVILFAMVMLVYAFVWLCSYLINRDTARGINEALKNFNADED